MCVDQLFAARQFVGYPLSDSVGVGGLETLQLR